MHRIIKKEKLSDYETIRCLISNKDYSRLYMCGQDHQFIPIYDLHKKTFLGKLSNFILFNNLFLLFSLFTIVCELLYIKYLSEINNYL